jgi:hypothetical protein
MGLSMVNMPSLRDYVNMVGSNQLNSFQSAVEFGIEAGYRIMPAQYSVEAAYEINSFSGAGNYQLSYSVLKPSIMYYRVYEGQGYQFKVGGGAGPRFLNATERINYETNYNSTGWGIVGRVDASTQISSIAYAYIGGELRYDYLPAPSSANGGLGQSSAFGSPKFSAFSAGIKLGVLFIL